jgi:hypothetical protein
MAFPIWLACYLAPGQCLDNSDNKESLEASLRCRYVFTGHLIMLLNLFNESHFLFLKIQEVVDFN